MNIINKIDLLLKEAYATNKVETPITNKEAEEIIKTKCKRNSAEGPILFRGNKAIYDDYYLFTGKELRASANTQNYYTVLLNHLTSWSKFPKRDHSLICTTSETTAEDFGSGNVFEIIPFDSSGPFGNAGSKDFWYIINKNPYWNECGIDSMGRLNTLLLSTFGNDTIFISNMKKASMESSIENSDDKTGIMLAFCALWYEGKNPSTAWDLAEEYVYESKKNVISNRVLSMNFLDILNKILAPENTKATLTTSFSSLKSQSNVEVWFDTPAILRRISE